MRVYIDTGVLIDYLANRGHVGMFLRSGHRRQRAPELLSADASEVLERCQRSHEVFTSCLTLYEGEHALFQELEARAREFRIGDKLRYNVISARSVSLQFLAAVDYYQLKLLDLDRGVLEASVTNMELQKRAIRAADALHVCTAIAGDMELLVSGDDDILGLDGVFKTKSGTPMRCMDTDAALALL